LSKFVELLFLASIYGSHNKELNQRDTEVDANGFDWFGHVLLEAVTKNPSLIVPQLSHLLMDQVRRFLNPRNQDSRQGPGYRFDEEVFNNLWPDKSHQDKLVEIICQLDISTINYDEASVVRTKRLVEWAKHECENND